MHSLRKLLVALAVLISAAGLLVLPQLAAPAPQQTGEYLIECTVKCGRGHDDMNMKLIIKS